ncbi:MAG: PEGA domain-containing protein [Spirochaetaceae bacterium]|nr:MAG: PEGA domain-containing protein [Spirochaetaceae bacterium]
MRSRVGNGGVWRCAATVAVTVVAIAALSSCAGLPRPRAQADSLLVFVVDHDSGSPQARAGRSDALVLSDGVEEIQIAIGRSDEIATAMLTPGSYRVVRREGSDRVAAPEAAESDWMDLVVPASTVVLAPIVLLTPIDAGDGSGIGARPVHPDDQRRAANALRSDARFTAWAGRNSEGFAPFSPFEDFLVDRFEVTIATEPPGAAITINGEYWGDAPVDVYLPRGKHYVEHRLDGHETVRSYLSVDGPGRSDTTLARDDRDAADPAGAARVVVGRFRNLGAASDDYLAELFTDAIVVALFDEGLEPIRSDEPDAALATAERIGAQLVVTGSLLEDRGRLITHAVLSDVRTELVKAALLLERPGGFAVFDSIDTVASDFASSVTRVLPEVGRAVIEERPVTAESIAYTERLTEQVVIGRRLADDRVTTISAIYGTVMDQIDVPWTDAPVMRADGGPSLGLSVTYEHPLALPLALALKASTSWSRNRDGGSTTVAIGAYTGPRLSFYNLRNDVYLSLLGAAHWASASSIRNWETDELYDIPASVMATIAADVGIKLYLRPGRRAQSRFVDLGFTLGIAGVRAWADFTDGRFFGPELWLTAGVGRRR